MRYATFLAAIIYNRKRKMQQSTVINIERLLAEAKKKGLTQEKLCKKAGVNRCIIPRLREGKIKTKLSTISKLLKALNDD
jgi:predicted transcriptional regulator